MKKHITLLLLFTPFLSFAQSNWKVGVHFGPTIEYRSLSHDNSNTAKWIYDSRQKVETSLFSFYGGVMAERTWENSWSVESGLHYSRRGYNMLNTEELAFEDQIDPVGGFKNGSSESYDNNDLYAVFNYLRWSVLAKKYIGQNDLKLMLAAGSTFDYLIQTNQGIEHIEFRKFNISPMLQAGLSYQLNEKSSIQTAFHYSIGVINITDNPVTAKLWGTGLKLSYFRTL